MSRSAPTQSRRGPAGLDGHLDVLTSHRRANRLPAVLYAALASEEPVLIGPRREDAIRHRVHPRQIAILKAMNKIRTAAAAARGPLRAYPGRRPKPMYWLYRGLISALGWS